MNVICAVCSQTQNKNYTNFFLCERCGVSNFIGNENDSFEVLGFKKSMNLNFEQLQKKYFELSRMIHPDRFVTKDIKVKNQAQKVYAIVNQAYNNLKHPGERLALLIQLSGVAEGKESDHQLAEEFFEIQESAAEDTKEIFIDKAKKFKTKLNHTQSEVNNKIEVLSESIDWDLQGKESSEIKNIIELKHQQNYINSLHKSLDALIDSVRDG